MLTKRYINAEIRRTLRKEVNFCCPICGCPILEYHHIIPWSNIQKHLVEEMIALCPNCHALADNGRYNKEHLYSLKSAGRDAPGWKHAIKFSSENFSVKVGATEFLNEHNNLLQIDNESMLSINRLPESNIILNTLFYNARNQLMVSIVNNGLEISTPHFGDIEYNGKILIIRKKPRTIIFEIEFNSEGIWFKKGTYHFGSCTVKFTENRCIVNNGKATVYLGNSNVGTIIAESATKQASPIEHIITRTKRIGRNELCTCGSGIKFKKCCGK